MTAEVIDECLSAARNRSRGEDAHPLAVKLELHLGMGVQPAPVAQFLGNRHLALAGDTHGKNLTSNSYFFIVSLVWIFG